MQEPTRLPEDLACRSTFTILLPEVIKPEDLACRTTFKLILPEVIKLIDVCDSLEIIARHLVRSSGIHALRHFQATCWQAKRIVRPVLIEFVEVERRVSCSRDDPWHVSHCPLRAPLAERYVWARECRQLCAGYACNRRRIRRSRCSTCGFGFAAVVSRSACAAAATDDADRCCNPRCSSHSRDAAASCRKVLPSGPTHLWASRQPWA